MPAKPPLLLCASVSPGGHRCSLAWGHRGKCAALAFMPAAPAATVVFATPARSPVYDLAGRVIGYTTEMPSVLRRGKP